MVAAPDTIDALVRTCTQCGRPFPASHFVDRNPKRRTALTVKRCVECRDADVNTSRSRSWLGLGKRSTTIGLRTSSRVVHLPVVDYPTDIERPMTRGACVDGPRPCPWVSCKYHLYLDVTDAGGIKLNFPDREVDELEHTCALDVADEGGVSLEEVALRMNVTRERVRQIEEKALVALRPHSEHLEGLVDEEPLPADTGYLVQTPTIGRVSRAEDEESFVGMHDGVPRLFDAQGCVTREAEWSARVNLIYERALADRGLVEVKKHERAGEIISALEEKVMGARSEESKQIADIYNGLAKQSGERPSTRQVAEAWKPGAVDAAVIKKVANSLYHERVSGRLVGGAKVKVKAKPRAALVRLTRPVPAVPVVAPDPFALLSATRAKHAAAIEVIDSLMRELGGAA